MALEREWLARLRHEMAHPPFHTLLGPQAVSVDLQTQSVVVRLPSAEALRRSTSSNYFHGGALAALVDLVAHAAVAVQIGRSAPTIDLRIDYLRPAPGEDLYAVGRTLRLGRSIAHAEVEVRTPAGRLLVVGRGTFSTLHTE
jgi:uncharacterized protein (TIGR00369 family)